MRLGVHFLHGGLGGVRPGFDKAILLTLGELRSCRGEVGLVPPRWPALGVPHGPERESLQEAGQSDFRYLAQEVAGKVFGPRAMLPRQPRPFGAVTSARTFRVR